MILLALLLSVSGAAVEVSWEVGWAGQPVVSVVNPLWLTVSNPSAQPFSGEVQVRGTAGSPWRGEATRTASAPIFLAPWGRTTLVLPWSVDPGMTGLQVRVFSGETEVFAREVALRLEAARLHGGIGPPGMWPRIFLSPADLPDDPLLLWPFSELEVSVPLALPAAEVVRAWQAFLGGKSSFGRSGVASVQGEPLRQRLRALRPAPPIWSVLVPGIVLYLVALGPGLGGLARGRAGLLRVLVALFLGLSLCYSVFRESAEGLSSVSVRITSGDVSRFSLELVGIISWRAGQSVLPGWWHELLPSRGWTGFDLRWAHTPDGWTTVFSLTPGVPRIFLRVAPEDEEGTGGGEPISPPSWLQQTLDLPWEEAQVQRIPPSSREAESFHVALP